ncbi:MAG: radical SAM protein [Dehalococcoidia bacterium]|nr:MAG: radical SAM protein [Dehalococcoidia bacterium]
MEKARSLLTRCHLCARNCGVNRLNGESGQCRTANEVIVSSFGPHFGEEAPLVGRSGSGTIFFAYCNLHCVFCQNYSISQLGEGNAVDSAELASMMLSLQAKGCHNINLVSPTHVVPFILEALEIAAGKGLQLPIVYNTGGYDSVATLELLDGVVDIYMPDMKYSEEKVGERFSGVRRYPQVNRAAVKEMHRQVGDLQVDESGVATRGLLVRHLVLPSELAGTEDVVKFLAEEISTSTYLNVMAQYHPCYHAFDYPKISRPVSGEEFSEAVKMAQLYGLNRLDERVSLPLRLIPW